jgi:hypothetical protein
MSEQHMAMPAGVKIYNGSVLCDMFTGPCACGAWHSFEERAEQAMAAFNALPPEEQAKQCRLQAISFAYGNTVLSNPDVTYDMCERAFDERAEKAGGK